MDDTNWMVEDYCWSVTQNKWAMWAYPHHIRHTLKTLHAYLLISECLDWASLKQQFAYTCLSVQSSNIIHFQPCLLMTKNKWKDGSTLQCLYHNCTFMTTSNQLKNRIDRINKYLKPLFTCKVTWFVCLVVLSWVELVARCTGWAKLYATDSEHLHFWATCSAFPLGELILSLCHHCDTSCNSVPLSWVINVT